MAISQPIDLLTGFPGWSTRFELAWRQEQSRHASGRTRVKDFGSPLWSAAYQSRPLSRRELDHWRARLDLAENGLVEFYAYQTSRCRPMAHQGSGSLPQGTLSSIGANRKSISLSGLDGIALSVGDMLSIGGDLHRVMENSAASSTFEVRPHLWPGRNTGAAVILSKPSCRMTVVPGSIATTSEINGWGSVSWQAVESRG